MNVVALSGGKDSTALAIALREREPDDYIYICTPTGDELPEMIAHWRKLEHLLQQPILRIHGPTLSELVVEQKMIPTWRARFCTRIIKIAPMQEWINGQTEPVTLCVGLRADEEGREGGIYKNATVRFPFREWGWGLEDVQGYLACHGVTVPRRTDCARCLFQSLPEWWELWKGYPEIWADIERQEADVGHTWRSPGRDTWPASLAELRAEFERGRMPRGLGLQDDMFGLRANQCRVCSL